MPDIQSLGAEYIESVVRRYLELVANGTADDVAALYASDATVEDPVGGEVHIGRHAIGIQQIAFEYLDNAKSRRRDRRQFFA